MTAAGTKRTFYARRGDRVNRRAFITLLGGAAAAWPLTAPPASRADAAHRRADESHRGRCGGTGPPRGIPAGSARSGLGRRPQRARRHPLGGSDVDRIRKHAVDLVALAPNVILASTGQVMAVMQQATRTVPIVFTAVSDPVASGYVDSLGRPGGENTRFKPGGFGLDTEMAGVAKKGAPHGTAGG